MINIPIIRWGKPYDSLELDEVVHFATGEPIAKVSQTNGGIITVDMRKARKARQILCEIPSREILDCLMKSARRLTIDNPRLGDSLVWHWSS